MILSRNEGDSSSNTLSTATNRSISGNIEMKP